MLKLLPSKVLLASSSLLLLSSSTVNAEVRSFEATRLMSSSRVDVGTQTMQDVSPQAQVNRELVDTGVQPDNDVQKILNSVDDVDIDAENGDEIEPVDVGVQTDDLENDNPSDKDLLDEIVKLQDSDSGRTDTKAPSETRARWILRNIVWPWAGLLLAGEFGSVLTRAIQQGSVKNMWPVFIGDMSYLAKKCKNIFSKKAVEKAAKKSGASQAWF